MNLITYVKIIEIGEVVRKVRNYPIYFYQITLIFCFVRSIAGHYADLITMPISVYAASKYAVTGMTASLRNEIINAKLDIKITVRGLSLLKFVYPNSILIKHRNIAQVPIYLARNLICTDNDLMICVH